MAEVSSEGSATDRRSEPAARAAPGDGDVRPRRGHVADERLHRRRRARPRHDRQRCAVRDRPRSPRLRGVHHHRRQGRRPDRPQEGLRARPPGLRDGRRRDDPGAGPHGDHHLLGRHRRARRGVAAARHAVADPRELRRRRAQAGLRTGRGRGRHRRGGRPAPRRVHHDVPVVAARVRPRGAHHRRRALRPAPGARRALPRPAPRGPRRVGALGGRDGQRRAGHPRLAGGR